MSPHGCHNSSGGNQHLRLCDLKDEFVDAPAASNQFVCFCQRLHASALNKNIVGHQCIRMLDSLEQMAHASLIGCHPSFVLDFVSPGAVLVHYNATVCVWPALHVDQALRLCWEIVQRILNLPVCFMLDIWVLSRIEAPVDDCITAQRIHIA